MPLPGDPDALDEACRQLAAAARAMQATGEAVAGHGQAVTTDWTGLAAPLALARTHQDAANARRVAEATNSSIGPLSRYAEELRAAQQEYARGEAMAAEGRIAVSGLGPEAAPAAEAARDRALRVMDNGTTLMRAAEERARAANEAAARSLAETASSLDGIAPPPPTPATTAAPLVELGNVAASLGHAALERPADAFAVLGGGALAVVSATGVLASVALTATGGGAVAGVPGGAVSAAGVAAGVGFAGAGLLDLATHAATDNAVAPFQVDQQREPVQGPAPFPPPSEITGKTRHGEEQAESRNGGHGVSDEAMEDAISNPVAEPRYEVDRRTYVYTGKDAVVALNESGKVVTTWPLSKEGYRHP